MIARFPFGGVVWDYGHYALGLQRLGFEVFYLEDTGVEHYQYDPLSRAWVESYDEGVRFLADSLAGLSPELGHRWHFRAANGEVYGIAKDDFETIASDADLFLNVSGGCLLRNEYRKASHKAFIDTDPGLNHFLTFPRWDALPVAERALGFRGHDSFFTYALNIGQRSCPLDDFGLTWHPTVPPVVPELWFKECPAKVWSTIMTWNHYEKPVVYKGQEYGAKECEFHHITDIPKLSPHLYEIAVSSPHGDFPKQRVEEAGWRVVDGMEKSVSPDAYRTYIQDSRAELSIAKNIYVATCSGWFSCRSTCYLAAGRPTVLQDTGFSETLPTGEGLIAFSNLNEALRAVDAVEADYARHSRAARDIAHDFFDAEKVLSEILEHVGLG